MGPPYNPAGRTGTTTRTRTVPVVKQQLLAHASRREEDEGKGGSVRQGSGRRGHGRHSAVDRRHVGRHRDGRRRGHHRRRSSVVRRRGRRHGDRRRGRGHDRRGSDDGRLARGHSRRGRDDRHRTDAAPAADPTADVARGNRRGHVPVYKAMAPPRCFHATRRVVRTGDAAEMRAPSTAADDSHASAGDDRDDGAAGCCDRHGRGDGDDATPRRHARYDASPRRTVTTITAPPVPTTTTSSTPAVASTTTAATAGDDLGGGRIARRASVSDRVGRRAHRRRRRPRDLGRSDRHRRRRHGRRNRDCAAGSRPSEPDDHRHRRRRHADDRRRPRPAIPITFDGGAGDDTVRGPPADSTWTISGAGAGTVGAVTFTRSRERRRRAATTRTPSSSSRAARSPAPSTAATAASTPSSSTAARSSLVSSPTTPDAGTLIVDGHDDSLRGPRADHRHGHRDGCDREPHDRQRCRGPRDRPRRLDQAEDSRRDVREHVVHEADGLA